MLTLKQMWCLYRKQNSYKQAKKLKNKCTVGSFHCACSQETGILSSISVEIRLLQHCRPWVRGRRKGKREAMYTQPSGNTQRFSAAACAGWGLHCFLHSTLQYFHFCSKLWSVTLLLLCNKKKRASPQRGLRWTGWCSQEQKTITWPHTHTPKKKKNIKIHRSCERSTGFTQPKLNSHDRVSFKNNNWKKNNKQDRSWKRLLEGKSDTLDVQRVWGRSKMGHGSLETLPQVPVMRLLQTHSPAPTGQQLQALHQAQLLQLPWDCRWLYRTDQIWTFHIIVC